MDTVESGMVKSEAVWVNLIARHCRSKLFGLHHLDNFVSCDH